ncbi:MAG: hypothetical protein HOV68_24515 [Streptomycetaceae bacterium]|nr:hypothetical protein [Streptomycetaceae bacterium]
MFDTAETSQTIPQLAVLGFGLHGREFQITASIAKGLVATEPLWLAAPLAASVAIIGPGGRIAWAERIPVSLRGGLHTGDRIEIDAAGSPPLIFDLTVPDSALMGGFTWKLAMQALRAYDYQQDSPIRLHVSVTDPAIARFRAAVGAPVGDRDGLLVGSWPDQIEHRIEDLNGADS